MAGLTRHGPTTMSSQHSIFPSRMCSTHAYRLDMTHYVRIREICGAPHNRAPGGNGCSVPIHSEPEPTVYIGPGIQPEQGSMRFMLYHRSGVTVSGDVCLNSEEGHKRFLGIFTVMAESERCRIPRVLEWHRVLFCEHGS